MSKLWKRVPLLKGAKLWKRVPLLQGGVRGGLLVIIVNS